jgi:iron complex outermembrane receptor protein
MKKSIFILIFTFICATIFAQESDTTMVALDEIVVSSFYQNSSTVSSVVNPQDIARVNYGQEPSHVFSKMPSIISLSDNGTEFGYGYYRIRGLDQTRINVTLDGCPWNEAEDYGSYFANSPDLMSSMQRICVERGAGSSYNGIAGVAGGIMLESINLYDTLNESYVYLSGGSYWSHKGTVVYNMHPQNGWGLHVKATHQYTKGFRDYGFNSSQAITIKTGYKFNERHSIDFLSMNGFHRNGQGWIGNTLEELELNPRANGNIKSETDGWFMSMNRLQYKMWATENLVVSSTVYFQFQDGSYRFDLDNYMKRMVGTDDKTNVLYDYGLTHNMIGANVVGKYYLSPVTLTIGVNGYTFSRKHFIDNKSVNVSNEEYYNNRGVKTDVTTFAMLQYKPIKGLVISGNVQYRYAAFDYIDYVDRRNSFYRDDNGTEWGFCNYGFNVEYTPVNSTKIYAKFNNVNREPTRSDMFGGNETFKGELTTINHENAKDVEVGVEYTLGRKVYANINLYNMWFKNELILNGKYGVNGLPCHDNAIKSYRRGIEADVKWNIYGFINLDVNGSYSFNKATTDTFGKTNHILTPSATFNADLYWDNYDFNIGFDTNYRSKLYVDMENKYSIPYLWTLNFHGLYRYRDFEFGVRINNITNKINYCTAAVNEMGKLLYFRNAGTNFNISVKYLF